ncbi:MAG: CDP-glycerol glycerophosphotransferase family protein [Candidatus Bathyarchaeia archaeon]
MQVEKPDIIIVMTDSTPPCRIAVLAGRLDSIPSLLLLLSGMIGRNYQSPSFIVDKIAVPGEFAREVLEKCGVDKEKLVVTGYPSYDVLVKAEEHFKKNEICKKLGLDPARKIVVYTTENLPARESKIVTRAVCTAVKSLQNIQFIIKVHPSELDLSTYRHVTRDLELDALITRHADIYEVLYACDALITGFSATALDAMILQKPVITINLTGLADPLSFAESGAAIGVNSEGDLEGELEKVLYNKELQEKLRRGREAFVFKHAYKLDGESTERVVTLVEKISK